MKRFLSAFLLCLSLAAFCQGKPGAFSCVIQGRVMNAKSTSVKIVEKGKDPRFYGVEVPVDENGYFRCELKDRYNRLYDVILYEELKNGTWFGYEFASEPGNVKMEIYQVFSFPENAGPICRDSLYDRRKISGGPLSTAFQKIRAERQACDASVNLYYDRMEDLREAGEYYSEEAAALSGQIERAKDSSMRYRSGLYEKFHALRGDPSAFFSEKCFALWQKADSTQKDCARRYLYDYIDKKSDIVSYLLLGNEFFHMNSFTQIDSAAFIQAFRTLAAKFPEHPYTATIGLAVNSLQNTMAGTPFTDLTAKDLSGAEYSLSQQIKGKIAVLDLWASWCGPCIEKGMKLKPVYEKYRDKGFTVVGVAREFKNTKALEGALKRTEYPWLNLVELDDQHRIWEKYGCPNSGGRVVLIGKEGKIVAIDPTVEQIEAYLEANLP